MRTDCTSARRWDPWKTMNGTRGEPVPKSLDATAIENADGPDTGVGRVAAGAAHPASTTTPINQTTQIRYMVFANIHFTNTRRGKSIGPAPNRAKRRPLVISRKTAAINRPPKTSGRICDRVVARLVFPVAAAATKAPIKPITAGQP